MCVGAPGTFIATVSLQQASVNYDDAAVSVFTAELRPINALHAATLNRVANVFSAKSGLIDVRRSLFYDRGTTATPS